MGWGFADILWNGESKLNELKNAYFRSVKRYAHEGTAAAALQGVEETLRPTRQFLGGATVDLLPGVGILAGNAAGRAPSDWAESWAAGVLGEEDRSGRLNGAQTFDDTVNNGAPGFVVTFFSGKRITDLATGAPGIPTSKIVDMREVFTTQVAKLKGKTGIPYVTVDEYNAALAATVDQIKQRDGENVGFSLKMNPQQTVGALFTETYDSRDTAPVTNFALGHIRRLFDKDAKINTRQNGSVIDNFKITHTISIRQLEQWGKEKHPDIKNPGELVQRYFDQLEDPFNTAITDDRGNVVGTLGLGMINQSLPQDTRTILTGAQTPGRFPARQGTRSDAPDRSETPQISSTPQDAPSAQATPPGLWNQTVQFVQGNQHVIGIFGLMAAAAAAIGGMLPLALLGVGAAGAAWGSNALAAKNTNETNKEGEQAASNRGGDASTTQTLRLSSLGNLAIPHTIRGGFLSRLEPAVQGIG